MNTIDFIEWCGEQGIVLCKLDAPTYDDGEKIHTLSERYWPVRETAEGLLHRMLEIDPVELENERRAMLEELHRLAE